MHLGYAIKHWLITILVAPFTAHLIALLVDEDQLPVSMLWEAIWAVWILGLFFSTPALFLYLGFFYLLLNSKAPVLVHKAILITASIAGIIFSFTFLLYLFQLPEQLALAYIATSVIAGMCLTLGKNEALKPLNIPMAEN